MFMVMASAPGSSGVLFCSHKGQTITRHRSEYKRGHCIVGNNNSKPIAVRQISPAEFARLSPSMKATLLVIRRAQLSSRRAIAAAAEWKRRCGESF
jgi:hypothetical protein